MLVGGEISLLCPLIAGGCESHPTGETDTAGVRRRTFTFNLLIEAGLMGNREGQRWLPFTSTSPPVKPNPLR